MPSLVLWIMMIEMRFNKYDQSEVLHSMRTLDPVTASTLARYFVADFNRLCLCAAFRARERVHVLWCCTSYASDPRLPVLG